MEVISTVIVNLHISKHSSWGSCISYLMHTCVSYSSVFIVVAVEKAENWFGCLWLVLKTNFKLVRDVYYISERFWGSKFMQIRQKPFNTRWLYIRWHSHTSLLTHSIISWQKSDCWFIGAGIPCISRQRGCQYLLAELYVIFGSTLCTWGPFFGVACTDSTGEASSQSWQQW